MSRDVGWRQRGASEAPPVCTDVLFNSVKKHLGDWTVVLLLLFNTPSRALLHYRFK